MQRFPFVLRKFPEGARVPVVASDLPRRGPRLLTAALRPPGRLQDVGADHGADLTDEIGAPDPQLEPQITSFDKCKTNTSISETPVY